MKRSILVLVGLLCLAVRLAPIWAQSPAPRQGSVSASGSVTFFADHSLWDGERTRLSGNAVMSVAGLTVTADGITAYGAGRTARPEFTLSSHIRAVWVNPKDNRSYILVGDSAVYNPKSKTLTVGGSKSVTVVGSGGGSGLSRRQAGKVKLSLNDADAESPLIYE